MANDIRKFWLENQNGDLWYFTDEESKTFFDAPTGLGINLEYGGYRLGNAEVINYQNYDLLAIQGTLLFFRNSRAEIYKDYFDFMNFIANNSLLKLHYKTPNSFDSFYRYCFVRKVDKTQINSDALAMECPITFQTQTFWRNDNKNVVVVDNSIANDGKSYELTRSYYYPTSKLSNIKVLNRGNTETALKVTIEGEVTNPTLNVYDNSNDKYGAMRMLGTFDKVIVDSDDISESIVLEQDGATLVAPYSYQDLSIGSPNQTYITFLKLKSGESSLRFNADNSFNGIVTLEWSDEYVAI